MKTTAFTGLRLTLEQALAEQTRYTRESSYAARVWVEPDGTWCVKGGLGGPGARFATWPEAFSAAWGVTVLARDPADEMRAAIWEWAEASLAARTTPVAGADGTDNLVRALERRLTAEARLLALARDTP